MFSLRPTREDAPESLLERLDLQMQQAADGCGSKILPLVLDLSDFRPGRRNSHHSPAEEGTLANLVDAIRSHEIQSNSAARLIGYSLVGITNLPLDDESMVEEAQSLNLPILQSNMQITQNNVGVTPNFLSAAPLYNGKPMKPKRKRRGGVAPLLRQRRPGVASSDKTVNKDATTTGSSTLTTRDDGASHDENAPDVQIIGTGKLPFHSNNDDMTTKVHMGSVRSGQLLSSDRPNQSVVVVGSINPGGEVWSEGDVYVFGKLRGRVLAGLSNVGGSGDKQTEDEKVECRTKLDREKTNASSDLSHPTKLARSSSRIFATSFDPELVCIGDVFTTVDDVSRTCGLDRVGPAMVTVDEMTGELAFERMEL